MILNLGSAIFNAETASGGGTPAWGTEMGQGNGYRFNFEDYQDFITALVYNSIPNPQSRIYCPLGKGGNQAQDYEFVVASMFDKIFVNGELVNDAKFILLVVKKLVGANHVGRRTLKYNPRITLDNVNFNSRCFDLIANKIGVKSTGSWFVSELNVKNQDELHFTAHILDENITYTFTDSDNRSKTLASKIKAYAETKQNNNLRRFADDVLAEYPIQQIYFGAPGTGKSHEIKKQVKKHKSFRITFHPDTDYSSFVGAYKPTSVEVPMLTTLGDKAIPMKDVDGNPLSENKIIYSYVKQAFLNAYIEAWKEQENETPKPVFLVIEEINRGNCAQIFGDIFQLLDRNDAGFSDYSIVPDSDLSRHVSKDLKDLNIANREKINAIYEECEADMVGKVLRGDVLLLPNNLYIWATMNTSDQSLFPIDSAFKRRWDWKYIKIANANKNWQIKIGSETFDWWQFVQAINYFVFDATKSEDKNLGYFFAKAKDKENTITAETFVSKVIFYLYTDVFKDYGFSGDIFKGLNDEEMTFQSFYNADGSPCNAQIIRYIKNVIYSDSLPKQLKAAEPTDDEDMNVYDEGEAVDNRTTSNHDKYKVNGVGSYGKCRALFEAVKTYASLNPEMTAIEIASNWTNLNVNHLPHLVETEQQFEDRASSSTDNKFRDKAKKLVLPNNEVIYVSNQFNPIRIKELIDKLNSANLGVTISLIED